MAANTRNYYHVIEMAAYKLDNNFWREKHVKMDSCLLPEIDKKKIVHWTMGCLEQRTNLHITWEGSKYGNIVKIQNENGEYPTCQNVDEKNCGQHTKFRDKNLVLRIQRAKLQLALLVIIWQHIFTLGCDLIEQNL